MELRFNNKKVSLIKEVPVALRELLPMCKNRSTWRQFGIP